ncbi:MAG TPA: DUF6263 family protein [Labilithrix sp.]|nr:DUF6263 family protein [Labilithrix sp.]
MRAHSSSAYVLVLTFLVACGEQTPSNAPAPAAASAPATPAPSEAPAPRPTEQPKQDADVVEAPKPLEAKAPTVKVLEPGAAPRRALRYKFKAGVTERAAMDMKMSMTMATGGKDSPKIEIPTMRSIMRFDAKEVTPDGDLRVAVETEKVEVLKDAKVDPTIVAALEKEVVGLVGTKGTAKISPRGVATETDFELPPAASPKLKGQLESIRDAIRNMYMPLPEEEVGKGAKWEVTSRVPISGAMMDVKATYALQKLEADSAQADVELALSAPPNQPMQLPGLPPGASTTLDSLAGKGTGKASPSFVKLVGSGTSKLSMEMTSTTAIQGQKMSMKMSTDIAMSIGPSKAAPAAPAKK